jgi:signal transduction histidine kinase
MIADLRIPTRPAVVVAAAWLSLIGGFVASIVFDRLLADAGRSDLSDLDSGGLLFLVPVLSAAVVGSVLALHRPRHPVGWLFLGLSLLIVASDVAYNYAAYGSVARPGSLPLSGLMAVVEDKSFIPWLVVLTLILLYIPDGRLSSRSVGMAAAVAVASGVISFSAGLLGSYDGTLRPEPSNPLELEQYSGAVSAVRLLMIVALHAALLLSAGMLLARFWSERRAGGRQLRWLALAAVVLPALVVAAFVAATVGQEALLAILAGGFVAVLPLAAGLAVERDHLYGIDRLISRGLAYSLLTALLIGCYAVTVVVAGAALSALGGSSAIAVAIATLATAAIARPALRQLQDVLDKRFNRREFEALATIRRFVREPSPSDTIEGALRRALDAPRLAVAYWIEDRGQWVSEDGTPNAEDPDGVLLERRGAPLVRVMVGEEDVDRRLLDALLKEAGAELENARLRAAITLQLREVKQSRARILAAQLEERRRLERNLHDGAQQRLLAVALELRASEVSSDLKRQSEAIDAAVEQLQLAVKELRDLAHGLHPAALSDGGLASALEELASRAPGVVLTEICPDRFAPEVEEAAWFIACEAVANAVKHAGASKVRLAAVREDGRLLLSVQDDGAGGADPEGRGIRGITDRAEAVGGRLSVHSCAETGTLVKAELPCASP